MTRTLVRPTAANPGQNHSKRRRIRYGKNEAAAMLSISPRQLDRLRERGVIVARIDNGRVFFDHEELLSYAHSRPTE